MKLLSTITGQTIKRIAIVVAVACSVWLAGCGKPATVTPQPTNPRLDAAEIVEEVQALNESAVMAGAIIGYAIGRTYPGMTNNAEIADLAWRVYQNMKTNNATSR